MDESNQDAPAQSELDHARLEIVASYPTATEAGLAVHALDAAGIQAKATQEATATWFWHYGSALGGGVHVLVLQSELEKARRVLADDHFSEEEVQRIAEEFEPWHDEEESEATDQYQTNDEHLHLRHAFVAAVIGIIVFPPLVSTYSLYLICRHQIWKEENGGRTKRFYAMLIINSLSMLLGYWLFL